MKIKITFTIIFILLASLLFAQNKPYRVGTTAANFLEMGIGSAANSMGEAYVSVASDLSSIYWNPAGLGYLESNEVLFMYQPWIADINVSFAGAAIVIPQIGTLGLSVTNMDYGKTEVTTMAMQEGTGETYSAGEYAIGLSYGRKLADWFGFGASVKWISSNIWHMSANALALDLGVMVNTHFFSFSGEREDGMSIGMSISNYGTKMQYDGIDLLVPIDVLPNENGNYKDIEGQYRLQGWELPLIFRVGVSVKPVVTETQQLILAVDALHPNNNSESINIGAQYEIKFLGFGQFFLRGGYRGLYMDDTEYGLTLGAGVNLNLLDNNNVRMDVAYKEIGIFGNSMTYSIGVTF
ncbi:MAG: PorV/PorQ family protein [Ignavibacteriae bacterium]|nr:PorV/PorQ family protein [Ignavibacteriota bacterium]MCB9208929.1 PorV/PorQ family protein [Ignavibacteriales bacterium]MCB9218153.1 PorV/PorQ family protein [Ignavibacteriales bacterium]MCP5375421.1 PorV/PorQ family protein [Rickettsiaceae bacterium]